MATLDPNWDTKLDALQREKIINAVKEIVSNHQLSGTTAVALERASNGEQVFNPPNNSPPLILVEKRFKLELEAYKKLSIYGLDGGDLDNIPTFGP